MKKNLIQAIETVDTKIQTEPNRSLVIGGTGLGFPPFIQAENSRRLHELIAGSRFAVIDAPDADSRITYFHAEEIAALVEDFLSEL